MRRFTICLALSTLAAAIFAAPIVHACTGNQVLLEDNFQTFASNWGTPDDFHSVKNGQMVLSPPLNLINMYFSSGNIFNDMSACVDVAIATGGPKLINTFGGIAFWSVDVNNTYYMGVGPTGTFSVSRYAGGRYFSIVGWSANPAVKSGLNQVNHLRVVTKGTQATLYINDKQVAIINGQPPQGGSEIGLVASSGPRTRDVYQFSNLKVTN
jgi:hypothetical protein